MSKESAYAGVFAAMALVAAVGFFCGMLGCEPPSQWETFASFTALWALFRAIFGQGTEGR